MANVCVFCGSRSGSGERGPAYVDLARRFGAALAQAGHVLVYGGASVGLMGVMADAALQAGGEVVGVIPRSLLDREVAHAGLSRQEVVPSLTARKTRMIELSQAFVVLPGGIGTLDELFEVWTMAQLGLHDTPILFLDLQGYYDRLWGFLESTVQEGFLGEASMDRLERYDGEDPSLVPILARLREIDQATSPT